MFRRARLSVKPNVRPGAGARGSSAPNPQRGLDSPRPPEPAPEPAPKPAEPTDVPSEDPGGAGPREKAPRGSDEKTGGENNVDESIKSSSTVTQRRKRVVSASSAVRPTGNVPSQSHPLPAVNEDSPEPKPSTAKEKQPYSDRYRIYKAQKLREMLKEELRKEKKQWKNKYGINESQRPVDRSKMTMRDFIYYLPESNPMASSLEQEKKTEKSLNPVQTRDRQESKSTPDTEDHSEVEEAGEGPLLVPRVKVAEDGSIILDEESLTVEVLRTKGPCVVEENDPIFERGSTTTYSSFRKNYYSKPWSNKETDMFFLAISMVGTDFSMIGQLFPHRARIEIKNKFKREEKTNGWRIDKAFQEKRPFDFDFFAHLLQKVLNEEEKRKQKSAKNLSSKERKSPRPRKNVKVKNVPSEVVTDDPDECMSARTPDTEISTEDTQMVTEEECVTLSGQSSEEVPLEQDPNQKKRRRKKVQDDANEQDVNLLENVTVQLGPSEGEKHQNTCQSIRAEVDEGECIEEQAPRCTHDVHDIVSLTCGDKVEQRTDPILSTSQHQDTESAAPEEPAAPGASESSTSSPSEVRITALCEVDHAEKSCIEERNIGQKNKSLEAGQAESVKPLLRGRLRRPRPSLAGAAVRRAAPPPGQAGAESASSHSGTSIDKIHTEKDKMNTSDICGMENTERENPEAEIVSKLSEKSSLVEDSQPKVLRPARLTRGRLQRPKPNTGKVAERKDMITSQESVGVSREEDHNEFCVDKEMPQQVEGQSCQHLEHKDLLRQPENKDKFQDVQPDEPRAPIECLSIQEANEANEQVPILRTRFRKLKPNIVRGSGRRENSLEKDMSEEIHACGEKPEALREIVRLETLPGDKVPSVMVKTTIKETKVDVKETGIGDIFLSENVTEMTNITVRMKAGLKAPSRETSPSEEVAEMADTSVAMEAGLTSPERRTSPSEGMAEMADLSVGMKAGLKAPSRETSPSEEVAEMADTSVAMEAGLTSPERRTSPSEGMAEMADLSVGMKAGLKTPSRETSPSEEVAEMADTSVAMEAGLTSPERRTSPSEGMAEMADLSVGMKAGLKAPSRETSPSEEVAEMADTSVAMEAGLTSPERRTSPSEGMAEMADLSVGMKAGLKAPSRETSPSEEVAEMADTSVAMEAGLTSPERRTSPSEGMAEMADLSVGMKAGLKTPSRETSPSEEVAEMADTSVGMEAGLTSPERRTSPSEGMAEMADLSVGMKAGLKAPSRETSPSEEVAEMADTSVAMEAGLTSPERRTSPSEGMAEMADLSVGMKAGLKTPSRETSPSEEVAEMADTSVGMEAGLTSPAGETSPGEGMAAEMTDFTVGMEAGLKAPERKTSPSEGITGMADVTVGMEARVEALGRANPPKEMPEVIDATEEVGTNLEESRSSKVSPEECDLEKVKPVDETETDFQETAREMPTEERQPRMVDATEERDTELEETDRQVSAPRNIPDEVKMTGEMNADLKEIGGEIAQKEEVLVENDGSDVQVGLCTCAEGKMTAEKELADLLHNLKTSSQISELDKTEDQRTQPPVVTEKFSDTNLRSLPQEQKTPEVKPAPFVRSRFKRPKPNLARAASRKGSAETENYTCETKLGAGKLETVVPRRDSEQTPTLPSQPDMSSLMTSREKDKSDHKKEEACVHTEEDASPSNSCDLKEDFPSTQTQEKDIVVPSGTHKINTFQEEMKESVTLTAPPARGRLQRPKPNVRHARQRQVVGERGTTGVSKDERTVLPDDTIEKSLAMANSQIETEIEVVSYRVSECRVDEKQSPVILREDLHVSRKDAVDEKMIHENKAHVPTSAQLIRRKFQKVRPNLGRAHSGKEEEPGMVEGPTDESRAEQPEEKLLQQGNSDPQPLLDENPEILTSLEVSARRDGKGSKESGLAKNNVQLEVGPLGRVGEETVQDSSMSSVAEELCLSNVTSHPQLFKESNCPKIALDRRPASASRGEVGPSERRAQRKVKPSVTKARGCKRARVKASKKEPRAPRSVLVTLRASQEEEYDDAEDFVSDYEEESYHLAPEEVNKAPVFVPLGLRSPEPVSAQIEETMEELEITENVADMGCVAVVEPLLSNTNVPSQETQQEKASHTSFEVTTGEQSRDEPGTSDGSAEAAIALLTMGDLVLQSEASTEQSNGVCIFPDVHSKDKSHIPFSPDNVSHKIAHECLELSSPVINTSPASLEVNKIVSEEQNAREEVGLKEEVMADTTSTRKAASKRNSNLSARKRFIKPKPNLEVAVTKRSEAYREVSCFPVTRGIEVGVPEEIEISASKATELEDKNLGPVMAAESKEQSRLAHAHDARDTSISQEANTPESSEYQEEKSQEIQTLPPAAVVSSETGPPVLASGGGVDERSVAESLMEASETDGVLTLHVPEQCTPASILEVQQENVADPRGLAVNLFADVQPDGEDEQAFILTLVEIPVSAAEEFAGDSSQLAPSPFLPAPILVKSANTEEKGDTSVTLPVTSVGHDALCLSNSESAGSENPPADFDLISRKRFLSRLDGSSHVPPVKRSVVASRDDRQQYSSEVCSKEFNVFEERGESYKEQNISLTPGSTNTTSGPQKEQLESPFQHIGSRSLDKGIDTCLEKNVSQLLQDGAIASGKEERKDAASESAQVGSRTAPSRPPLSRPGRRPLGFLSLICSKSSLESDEPTQTQSKYRLKPLIPASRRNLKRTHPLSEKQKKTQESSGVLPSPGAASPPAEGTGRPVAQVPEPLLKKQRKGGQNRALESDELTTVSEHFFSDIFIEVEEAE